MKSAYWAAILMILLASCAGYSRPTNQIVVGGIPRPPDSGQADPSGGAPDQAIAQEPQENPEPVEVPETEILPESPQEAPDSKLKEPVLENPSPSGAEGENTEAAPKEPPLLEDITPVLEDGAEEPLLPSNASDSESPSPEKIQEEDDSLRSGAQLVDGVQAALVREEGKDTPLFEEPPEVPESPEISALPELPEELSEESLKESAPEESVVSENPLLQERRSPPSIPEVVPELSPSIEEETFEEERDFPAPAIPPYSPPAIEWESPAVVQDSPRETLTTSLPPGDDSVTLRLPGRGWVFRSDRTTSGGWRFLGRSTDDGDTLFEFRLEGNGPWGLVFERQDLSSGSAIRVTRNITRREDGGIDVETPVDGLSSADSTMMGSQENLEPTPVPSDSMMESESPSSLLSMASGTNAEAKVAREKLVQEAAATGDMETLDTWVPYYIQDGAKPEILNAAIAAYEKKGGQDEKILPLLAQQVSLNPGPESLFALAQALMKVGPQRDLDQAAQLFRRILDEWPLSSWSDDSANQLDWLDRHYFRIR